jgi:anti-sigma-K factor RskA
MTHDELHELTGGYVLGALSEAERQAFEAHAATCAVCAAEVKALRQVAHGLAYTVPQRDLPPDLRDRVLRTAVAATRDDSGRSDVQTLGSSDVREGGLPRRSAEREGGSALPAWLAIAASIAAVALGLYAMTLRQRIEVLQDRLREATVRAEDLTRQSQVAHAVADQAREASVVLAAADVRRFELAGQKDAPRASGRAFWSPSQRRLVFTAANLPAPPTGRQYQLWVVPPGAGRDPVSAGMLPLESESGVTLAPPLTIDQVGAVAVSEEPLGGVVGLPTGAIVLLGAAEPR